MFAVGAVFAVDGCFHRNRRSRLGFCLLGLYLGFFLLLENLTDGLDKIVLVIARQPAIPNLLARIRRSVFVHEANCSMVIRGSSVQR